jgi:N-acetylneuraminic acid mutarotase
MPVELAEIAGAALDGRIYTGGGFTPGGVARWFGAYDPTADAWVALRELPIAVHHMGFAAADGQVWLAGGYAGSGFATPWDGLAAYDPDSEEWTAKSPMPGGRAAHFLLAWDTKLAVVGGVGDATDRMWVYDIAADSWSDAPGPTPREHLGAAQVSGVLYVVAGRGFGRGIVGTLEAYDPDRGQWERLPDMPGVCGGCSAAATNDGRIHVTGGESSAGTHADHFVFDPLSGQWDTAADLPTARHGIAAVAVGERFFVIGGGRVPGLATSDIVEIWAPEPEAAFWKLIMPVAVRSGTD